MKRTAHPLLSQAGHEALASYEHWLREREDLTAASIRNYLSDLRHFIAWYETEREAHVHDCFMPQGITTSTLTRYRAYLQTAGRQKPASVNRSLISLKRYFGWTSQQHLIPYDPSVAVKLVGQEESAPRHLDDQEEQALVAAVTKAGTQRDRVLIVLLLHTGLRAREICRLRRDQVKLGKRSGFLMAESVPLHRLAQIMGYDSLDTTKLYIQGTKHDLQQAVETIAWT